MWCLALLCVLPLVTSAPVVTTKYGNVEGKTINVKLGFSKDKIPVNRYLGVPFAKPPVGDLRWKAPEEPDSWNTTFKANRLNDACIQTAGVNILWLTHQGWNRYNEDCLGANIYTPAKAPEAGKEYPVMVWFHGGGYISSANIQYPGYFLAARDVVVVVPNYRIGAFGFMSTGDDAARGNFGLLDQIRILEFVRDNAAAFYGDKNRVTLFGQSAGAASSGLLSLSPRSQDLFHQIITESGSDQAIWGINHPGSHPENYTKAVAKKLDCPTDDTYEMMDCMRTNNASQVLKNSGFTCAPGYFCQGFAPVVDGEGGVIPEDPWTMREKGMAKNTPVMSGQCSDDGSMYTVLFIPESLEGGFNRSRFEYHLRHDLLDMFAGQFPEKENEVFNALNWYYSPWPYLDDLDMNRDAFNRLITDFGWGFTGDLQMKEHSQKNDVFFYNLAYRSKKAAPLIPEWIGVPHNGELPYVFGWPYLQKNFEVRIDSGMLFDLIQWDDEDIEWSDYIQTLWTNFAKYGDPTPTPVKAPGNNSDTMWEKFTEDNMKYLFMNRTVETRQNYRQRDLAIWREYLPYVAGVDFIRPKPNQQQPTPEGVPAGEARDSTTFEKRLNKFIENMVRERHGDTYFK